MTTSEIETVRAALLYWQQEISPHADAAAAPYWEGSDGRPMSPTEIIRLRLRLATRVRYAICDMAQDRLISTELWDSPEAVVASSATALVLLPLIRS